MSSALASLTRIAIVACRACGSLQCLRMAVAAGRTAVVDSPSAFVGNARVRTIVSGKPVVRGMAARAIQPKHAGVENRIAVAACTIRC
jgi:hypothetical protein